MIKIYNSLSRKKEEFNPLKDKKVAFYVCGPTVYGPGHIGHARTYIAFDIIRRYLEHKGYNVKYVMNITDIHDDIIATAQIQKTDIFTLGNKYTKLFLEDQKKLGIKPATIYPRVTDNIEEIIKFIQELEEKGFAYEKDDSVYFDVSKFKDYGKLSGIKIKKAKTGTRVETDKYEREQAVDFVLWKKAKKGEPFWESPWGQGRPGWHIECSVMTKKHLGEQIDIHAGAMDLIFPHHENEIAQTEALAKKKPFVKYWLHGGLLMIDGQKMSKSLGNFITIDEVLKKWDSRTIRMFVASSHYRSTLDWTEKNILQAKQGLERIDDLVERLKTQNEKRKTTSQKSKVKSQNKKLNSLIRCAEGQFEKAMEDNFNTPEAMAILFGMIKTINPLLDKNEIDKNQAKKILEFLKEIDKIFNFIFPHEKEDIPEKIKGLAKQREKFRKNNQWQEADEIRKQIERLGFTIKDTANGIMIKRNEG
ncbi:cysteine--tRNA ligase [Patescibacteria group bacterium]|nr:cysteine--tRNA ligase [Patescibacteria group bacterium]MBU4162107.1 cysteine--tRNA ligase [Patescibacteria group bacterium]